ncbi:putative transcriptional regulator, TetR family protein [Vibrio inusitatus NBRC 102082]|uniref:Putative transcriptional regulator, TetR family protein n=1 Tax=Vibrio inusitatus NBRC 102082 TaxID=1219070 RepID=A0A4Y3HUZ5_9VIBR|nr:TetR family transcriptional regulator [Vibrio inusitatus]GEA50906.1 putative transcriptional regulator, TetR family protein [Vibrio inusitatus NBRC 102082]
MSMSTTKREHLIDSFIALVSEQGMSASGVDSIAKYANVSKKTIYNQFGSKEALAVEALTRFSNRVQANWEQDRVDITDPKALFLQFFTELEEVINAGLFHGCIFVNMCREYPELEHDIHIAAKKHKQAVQHELLSRLELIGCYDSDQLFHIELIYEGLMSKLLVYQDIRMVQSAKAMVLQIIEQKEKLR